MTAIQPLDPLRVALQGTHLIEASAGTGKTYTITTLYLRLLLERRLTIDQILVVTYTNAATAELRRRIRERLSQALAAYESGASEDETLDAIVRQRRQQGEARTDVEWLTSAVHGFDEAAISTIHGFCQRVLQEHAFESGASFDAELISNQTALLGEIAQDFYVQHLYDAPRLLVAKARLALTLGDLLYLAARATSQPYLTVLPAAPTDSLEASIERHRDVWQRARPRWAAARKEIRVLLGSPALKNSYSNPVNVENWTIALDALFAADAAAVCDQLVWFTTQSLQANTRVRTPTPTHPFIAACDELFAAQQNLESDVDRRIVSLRLAFIEYARTELARRKEDARQLFFDDLLHRVHRALAGGADSDLARRIRQRHPAALIDEFQDTDPVQYEIFNAVYGSGERCLFLIGDPKQSIYAFRGADIFSYMRASHDAENRRTLDTNFRSGPSLLRGINTLFRRDRSFFYDEIQFAPMRAAARSVDALGGPAEGRAPLQILLLRRDSASNAKQIEKTDAARRIASAIAGEIARLLASGALINGCKVQPNDIAVLCRTNKEATQVQQALRTLRIPSVLQGDSSVFLTVEAEELERVLRAVANPDDTGGLIAALSTMMLGLDSDEIRGLQAGSRDWDAWVERFHEWSRIWLERGFIPAFRSLIDEGAVQRRLLAYTDGERRLTNLFHLSELLQRESMENRRRPEALIQWLAQMRVDDVARGELVGEAAQVRLESDASALVLTTIHKSKGLEYPVVFCPFLADGLLLRPNDKKFLGFHDRDDEDRATLDLATTKAARHLELANDEALAENLRLLYVALTRAQHRCTLVWGGIFQNERSALAYLLHQRPGPTSSRQLAETTAARAKKLDDEQILRDLHQLAAESGGAIEIADLCEDPAPPYAGEESPALDLRPRTFARWLDQTWRTSSFSGLIANRKLSAPQEQGIDRDEVEVAVGLEGAAPEEPAATIVLDELPGGARMGTLVHEILEKLDFEQATAAVIGEQVAAVLRRQGMDEKAVASLTAAIGEIVVTPFSDEPGAPRLGQLKRQDRCAEMEFLFPVGSEGSSARLTRAALVDLFRRHPGPASRDAYVALLGELSFKELRGHLRGYIDLVFRHDARWYVVDYKSNRLGSRPDDYRPERLLPAMDHHHYFLQYHLYTVALHRYLRLRLGPEYDYDTHIGGAYYLFLRGMSPRYPRHGVFFDRPRRALIEELSGLLDG